MIFTETGLAGAFLVEPERIEDERGFFARTWSLREFAAHGIGGPMTECNISYNLRRGTLRGMHYQAEPHAQVKLVRCTAGAIYDVIVDLRPSSPTHGRWFAAELSASNRRQLYIPEGFAHGFQTLSDDAEVFYQMSGDYAPESGRGVRWDDPAFGIEWPLPVSVIAERDARYPDYTGG
jgi:dTDP-4-dehydrorhamnose 3,5-epimerase